MCKCLKEGGVLAYLYCKLMRPYEIVTDDRVGKEGYEGFEEGGCYDTRLVELGRSLG
jgi:hypothetical protein